MFWIYHSLTIVPATQDEERHRHTSDHVDEADMNCHDTARRVWDRGIEFRIYVTLSAYVTNTVKGK